MEGHTTGEAKIVAFFNKREMDLQKVCLLVTDGAPAMIGRLQGLTARLSTVAPHMSGDLKNTMGTVMNIVNFIRSTSSL